MQAIKALFLLNFVGWRVCKSGYSKCQIQFFAQNFSEIGGKSLLRITRNSTVQPMGMLL